MNFFQNTLRFICVGVMLTILQGCYTQFGEAPSDYVSDPYEARGEQARTPVQKTVHTDDDSHVEQAAWDGYERTYVVTEDGDTIIYVEDENDPLLLGEQGYDEYGYPEDDIDVHLYIGDPYYHPGFVSYYRPYRPWRSGYYYGSVYDPFCYYGFWYDPFYPSVYYPPYICPPYAIGYYDPWWGWSRPYYGHYGYYGGSSRPNLPDGKRDWDRRDGNGVIERPGVDRGGSGTERPPAIASGDHQPISRPPVISRPGSETDRTATIVDETTPIKVRDGERTTVVTDNGRTVVKKSPRDDYDRHIRNTGKTRVVRVGNTASEGTSTSTTKRTNIASGNNNSKESTGGKKYVVYRNPNVSSSSSSSSSSSKSSSSGSTYKRSSSSSKGSSTKSSSSGSTYKRSSSSSKGSSTKSSSSGSTYKRSSSSSKGSSGRSVTSSRGSSSRSSGSSSRGSSSKSSSGSSSKTSKRNN